VPGADVGGALSLLAAGPGGRCLWVPVLCWPRDGEAKLEAGAAAAGRVGVSQLTVVGVGQPPGDAQPQPHPPLTGRPSRASAAPDS